MKNPLMLLIPLIFCFILLSCNKDTQVEMPVFEVKTDYISRDTNFKNIIELENSLREQIEGVLFSKNITRNKLLNIIDSLKSYSKSNIDLKIKMNEQIAPGIYESLTQFETSYKSN